MDVYVILNTYSLLVYIYISCYRTEDYIWTCDKVKTSCGRKTATRLPLFKIDSIGPTQRTKQCTTPMEIFQLMFTTAIVEAIVQQTILFAQQKEKELSLCTEELLAFIGLNIAMGLIRLPQIQDYWNKNEVLATPFFPSIMSRDHFQSILRYLHLNNSTLQKKNGEEGYDSLFKIRPLLDHFSAIFPMYYQPAQHISIDEMMIGTRCRVAFLQNMPKKPKRFGIKVWILAEAKMGYVLDLQVYTGAEKDNNKKGLANRIVNYLIQKYQGKIIYFIWIIFIQILNFWLT